MIATTEPILMQNGSGMQSKVSLARYMRQPSQSARKWEFADNISGRDLGKSRTAKMVMRYMFALKVFLLF